MSFFRKKINFINSDYPLNIGHAHINNVVFFSCFLMSFSVFSEEYFNPNALENISGLNSEVNLESFSRSGGQAEGVYRVDIYVNNNFFDKRDVIFKQVQGKLNPELNLTMLNSMGVKTKAFPELSSLKEDDVISDISLALPSADTAFDFSQQRLDVSIPQAALENNAQGYIDPALYDQGIPVIFTNYGYSGSTTHYKKNSSEDTSNFFILRSGVNLGAWRLRNYSTWNDSNSSSAGWNSINSYLQRDIQILKSSLTAGDSSTPSDVFDSISYRGVQLSSDENMVPDSLRGFAPVIRGIAQSNAQVSVKQNGYIIYQTYVAPGPFSINDLYPTSSSGNLEVIIKESDGTERRSVQPFSAAPMMLRQGRVKYSLTSGQYRILGDNSIKPKFTQGTFVYGLPFDTTAYGGLIASGNYNAYALGAGHGFGDFGSLSLDITQSESEIYNRDKTKGQSYRLQYAKSISDTGTYFTLAGYRYSTSGYYDFREATEANLVGTKEYKRRGIAKKSKTQLNVTQTLGDWGNFYVAGYQQDYWEISGYERNFSTGYNFNSNGINYGLNITWNQSPASNITDRQVAFNVQVPLSKWLGNSWASFSTTGSKNSRTMSQAGISGTALADNNLSYSVQKSYSKGGDNGGNTSVGYKGTKGNVSAGYNYSNYSQQVSYGLDGAVVVHPHGVTLSQSLGDTFALVRTPGASGVKISNQTNIRTDWLGNAVVPYVSSYKKNRIAIDPDSLGDDVEIETKTLMVVPTNGAAVLSTFKTLVGAKALITVMIDGKPVPFGARVNFVEDNGASSIVSTNGQVYMSGLTPEGSLKVSWGQDKKENCIVNYKLPDNKDGELYYFTQQCRIN